MTTETAIKFILLILYSTLPPLLLAYTHKLIYSDKNKYGIHIQYILKFLVTVSILPLLFLEEVDLGLKPQNTYSIIFFLVTLILAFAGFPRAIRRKNLFFYNAGVVAGFMEEFLYRGIIFGLALSLWENQWVSLGVSSLLFGTWHLKNIYWSGTKSSIIQFLYTTLVYGPVFGLMRILTGDLYLAILCHYLTDATCALAPDWMRGWLVRGGKGKPYDDVHAGMK